MKSILCTVTLIIGMFLAVEDAFAYASLAIDSDQGSRWGFSFDYDNAYEADQRALAECGQGCRIVKNFATGCGAYAADQTYGGTAYGWGLATSEAQAKNIALDQCQYYGGDKCVIRVWACNSY